MKFGMKDGGLLPEGAFQLQSHNRDLEIAEGIADHIRQLSGQGQVFCITHLPQTAAIADHHYFIYKKEMDGRTVTQVRGLSEGEHVLEIARMFAGNDTTKASIEAARQIVKQVKGM